MTGMDIWKQQPANVSSPSASDILAEFLNNTECIDPALSNVGPPLSTIGKISYDHIRSQGKLPASIKALKTENRCVQI
jgi:hypothetical protein